MLGRKGMNGMEKHIYLYMNKKYNMKFKNNITDSLTQV